jgi:predicted nucleic acid-binding protein
VGSLNISLSGLIYVDTRLRAAIPSLRTPDALHAATSRLRGCAQFLTNDDGFRKVPGLPVIILREVLVP